LIFTEPEDKQLSLQMVLARLTRLGLVEEPLVLVKLLNHHLQMDMARLTRQLELGLVQEPRGGLDREILLGQNLVVKIWNLFRSKRKIISMKMMKNQT
jgi:hypothetical protein